MGCYKNRTFEDLRDQNGMYKTSRPKCDLNLQMIELKWQKQQDIQELEANFDSSVSQPSSAAHSGEV